MLLICTFCLKPFGSLPLLMYDKPNLPSLSNVNNWLRASKKLSTVKIGGGGGGHPIQFQSLYLFEC